jgi:peptidoglycan/xylan/chitin deacetylase (PgdA/CDA1 family)
MDNPFYDYSPIVDRPPIKWPNGARLAFYVGLNVEHYEIDKPSTSITPATAGLTPDPLNYGWRDYGPRVGVWRLMELLDDVGLKPSVLLNSDVPSRYPRIIEEGNRRGWCWLAHGNNNSTLPAAMPADAEREMLLEMVETITQGTGKKPKGWMGPALNASYQTLDILAEQGLTYSLDFCADDRPFPMKVKSGRMITVPYSIEVNDISLFVGHSMTGPEFEQLLVDQFEQLYEESAESGRVMAVAIHPFVIGQPFRAKYLARALDTILSRHEIWTPTTDEIADFYYEHCYAAEAGHPPAE